MTPTATMPVVRANKGDAVDTRTPPLLIMNDAELLRYGVVRVPLSVVPQTSGTSLLNVEKQLMDNSERVDDNTTANNPAILDFAYWAAELSQVTPAILAAQGDNEYAFYRNILEDEPDFPFDDILRKSQVREAMKRHFNVSISAAAVAPPLDEHEEEHHHNADDDVRLDDAFCVHYNTSQDDSSGARHTDPCDITVNICLQASDYMQGSQVLFHGIQTLSNVPPWSPQPAVGVEQQDAVSASDFSFLVPQIPGTATIHWGHHPHQTLPITAGSRTNVVMTYCYSDPSHPSDVRSRTCYG
jgi:hypothetical protein